MNSRPRRMPNFTTIEENVLRMLTEKYKNVIEQKGSGAVVWDNKKRAWQRIEAEFFNKTKVKRPSDKLKSKYESLKKSNRLGLININVKQEVIDPAPNQEVIDPVSMEAPPNPQSELEVANEEQMFIPQVDEEIARVEPNSPHPVVEDVPNEEPSSSTQVVGNVLIRPNQQIFKAELVVRKFPQNVVEVPKDEPKSPTQAALGVPKVEPPSQETMEVDQVQDLTVKQENNSTLSMEDKLNQEQYIFYRNKELRAQEKHLAEITNLEIQRKILEMELKIKERIYNNNNFSF